MNRPVQPSPFSEVLADFREGRMIIMVDDAQRENEGDLVVPAACITPEALSFMMHHGRGLICMSIAVETAKRLNLPLQTLVNNSAFQTPFAVSVDHCAVAAFGVTARARAQTIKKLLDEASRAEDFVSPGHVFPLIANPAGVLGRQGQTEGSFDLARIAGHPPAGVLCEILNPDGSMARGAEIDAFAASWNLKITSVAEVIRHRISHEILVRQTAEAYLETDYGPFTTFVFLDDVDGKEHLALVYGKESIGRSDFAPLVRIHSECLTGDVFGSRRCDCGRQLAEAARRIVKEGSGIILYLRQEGRGIGLANKVKAYALQDLGRDTVEANICLGFPADQRDFAVAAKILAYFNVSSVRLLTNNPEKLFTLEKFGVKVQQRLPLQIPPDEFTKSYLETKRTKLGHWL